MRFEDSIKKTVGLSIAKEIRGIEDRGHWRKICSGAMADRLTYPAV